MTEIDKYIINKLDSLLKGTKTCLDNWDKVGAVASMKYPLEDICFHDDIDMEKDYPHLNSIYNFYRSDECYNLAYVEIKRHREDIKEIYEELKEGE